MQGMKTFKRRTPSRTDIARLCVVVCAALASVSLTARPAQANPATTMAAISKAAKKKDFAEAVRLARQLESQLARQAPLEIVDLQLLPNPPGGLGIYTPLFKGELHQGLEEIYIYAHVRNQGMSTIAGFHHVHLVSDLKVMDSNGKVIADDPNFGESRFAARAPHRDTLVVVALRTKGLGQGAYSLELTLHDHIGKKKVSKKVEFRVL